MSSSPTRAGLRLQHRFRDALPELAVDWTAVDVAEPQMVIANDPLAAELGLDGVPPGLVTGNVLPDGARPVAMAYAGHQFGHFTPRLGDGRALLLGEVADADGNLRDLHLKGSGRTPFARGGDGLATIGPMLREYLIAEAMHAMGIPTGRALAVVRTGQPARRQRFEPGAVLARVAASHIRVGTFEYAARTGDADLLRRLTDHTIARHHASAADTDRPALALLDAVAEAQAQLVARWMHVGFIHGVMNTDNTFLSGETLDYGPCAFMDHYDPATVFSSIDRAGRYAFGNQPRIAQWNLARLAETLIPLIDDDHDRAISLATTVVTGVPERHRGHWLSGMAAKLGLADVREGDGRLVDAFTAALAEAKLDWTGTFRALAASLRDEDHWAMAGLEAAPSMQEWRARWQRRVADQDLGVTAAGMDRVNPVVIPRNHLVDDALAQAEAGEMDAFTDLLAHVTTPFTAPADTALEQPAPRVFTEHFQTYCGT